MAGICEPQPVANATNVRLVLSDKFGTIIPEKIDDIIYYDTHACDVALRFVNHKPPGPGQLNHIGENWFKVIELAG